ncbi:MAG: hypothetical protein JXD23_13370 [Spirochaetales bacterium]|nr:hypothetical protein [Spirochaetales bacterium]
MKNATDGIPDIVLERFLLGELDAERSENVRLRAETDETLRRRIEDLRRSNEELLKTHPAESMARAIRGKLEAAESAPERRRRRRPIPILAFAGAAAAALAVFLFLPLVISPGSSGAAGGPDVIRYKGDAASGSPSLAVYRLRGESVELLKDGAAVRPRDVVQVRYNALAKRYGAIVSIDGRGSVTLHWPLPPSTDVQLERAEALLPRSFELDDAPDFELFFFVTADAPFALDMVLAGAERLALSGNAARTRRLDLPSSFTHTSLMLVKENAQP